MNEDALKQLEAEVLAQQQRERDCPQHDFVLSYVDGDGFDEYTCRHCGALRIGRGDA